MRSTPLNLRPWVSNGWAGAVTATGGAQISKDLVNECVNKEARDGHMDHGGVGSDVDAKPRGELEGEDLSLPVNLGSDSDLCL